MSFDGQAFGTEMVDVVKGFVERATAPLVEEIAQLKARKSVSKAFIDRNHELVLTYSDGSTESLGIVVGKNGEPGENGKHGLNAEDVDMELLEDGKTLRMSLVTGVIEHSFDICFPVIVDRGVFSEGKEYARGDAVTWAGSLWIAQKDTSEKPGGDGDDWRLAVKKGRDGKDKS
ncbi:hypothetical protein WJT74_05140 [Sphingomicrobium sp. XHP0239]|uniref:hypothetical protein n=1 Tax=Sphingomicrobium maritimum TaxID=3133972 RepID=UPI0031CC87B3